MDSSSSPIREDASTDIKDSGSPKKLKVEERSFWLENLFVITPKYTFQTCKDKFDKTIDEFCQQNAHLVNNMLNSKETWVRIFEEIAYLGLFLKPNKGGLIKFNCGEFQFMDGCDHYLATCFISKHCQQHILLQEILFKPENCTVKFFVNELAEQNKNGPLYKMWDNAIYSKLFLPADTDTSTITRNLSDLEIRAPIEKAMSDITSERPENTFNCVRIYLDLCKKYNQLDLKVYESILSSFLYDLIIADLAIGNVETSHEKLLKYRTFYQSLLLKTVYFAGQTELTNQEMLFISKVKHLMNTAKLEMEEIYLSPDKGMVWLEREGVYLASFLGYFTDKMALKYMSFFNQLPYGGGFKLIYAERVYTYFIKPILNSTADAGIPEIDKDVFLNLFVPVTQYMHDTQQHGISHSNHFTRKELYLTENEWKGLRIWLKNSEENAHYIRKILAQYEKDNPQSMTRNNGVSMEIC